MTMTTIIASVIALFVGIAIGWFIMRLAMKYRAQNITLAIIVVIVIFLLLIKFII